MTLKYIVLATLLLLAVSLCAGRRVGQDPLRRIRIKGQWFVDQDDRVIIFHGINAVSKNPPWVPNYGQRDLFNDTQLQYLQDWGFNALRLGFMWSGLYPEKGKMNQTYVDQMTEIVNRLASHGIYTILEMHQDMLSSQFNSYDGAPLWAMEELPKPKHPYPWPYKNGSALVFQAYVTEACGFAFQCLYNNVSNFETYWQEFWKTTAKLFKDTESVLGYELMNEPWAGDIWKMPEIFLPGFAGRFNLMPLYERVYSEIRKIDEETIVMYEPVTWGVMSNGTVLGTGFDHPLGYDAERTVLSWHYYCWILQFSPDPLRNDTYPDIDKKICDDLQLPDYFKTVQEDVKQKLGNGPTFLTEYGVCAYELPDKPNVFNVDECKYMTEATDQYLQSWTYWDSNFYYFDTYQVNYQIVNVFSRVYPMATNGIPVAMSYNVTTQDFVYIFNLNITSVRQASLQTEIFIPKHLYPSGVQVTVPSFLRWTYDTDSNRVLIDLSSKAYSKFLDNPAHVLVKQAQVSISKK